MAQRELLVREGTARFADTAGEKDHHLQKMLQKHQENSRGISYGTIPYLGTFLTDLIMIDTAIPDVVSEGLINFDKRRKEFEVLAQVKQKIYFSIHQFHREKKVQLRSTLIKTKDKGKDGITTVGPGLVIADSKFLKKATLWQKKIG